MNEELFAELVDRLENAAGTLQAMAQAKFELGHASDYDRLRGKTEGVRLALSYIREMFGSVTARDCCGGFVGHTWWCPVAKREGLS